MQLIFRRVFYYAILLGCLPQLFTAQDSQSTQSDGNQSQVFVTASHKNGSPLTLSSSDLTLFVDKRPVRVVDIRSAKGDPLLFALLVDVSKSDGEEAKMIRELAVQIFRRLAVGSNRGYLVLFNDKAAMSQTPMSPEQAELNLNAVKFDRGTAIYDAIAQTATYKFGSAENATNPRRAIVLISDGEDNSSHINHVKAQEAAQEAHVAIFPVLIPSTFAGPVRRGPERMNDFSRATGGRLVEADTIPGAIQSLLSAVDEQWVISLVPASTANRKLHGLQIRSMTKDIKISAPAALYLP
jgi:VWFA-related protein